MSCIWGLFTVARVTVVTPGSLPRLPKPAQPDRTSAKLTPIPAIPRRRRMVAVMKGFSLWGSRGITECLRKRIRFVADATLSGSMADGLGFRDGVSLSRDRLCGMEAWCKGGQRAGNRCG